MQAIILAAGMGRRLGELTADNTKCMLEVNGIRIIDRIITQLSRFSLSRIIIVTGYEGHKLKKHIADLHKSVAIEFVDNPIYDKTNNIYSLWLTRELMMQEDTILLESDLVFEQAVLEKAFDSPYPNCALVAKYETWMDGTMVRIDNDSNIVNFIPKSTFKFSDTDSYYKTVNIYKFSKEFISTLYLPFLEAYIKVLGQNEYYEQVLRVMTLIDKCGIKALPIGGLRWYEIDDVQDLRIAEIIFANPEERLAKLQHCYGGYWRFPGITDFCYLVNPYFPPAKMIDEMKANFEPLLRDYPSGMGVNSLLAGKYFGIKQKYVAIGNGAAELIKCMMEHTEGKIGITYPTFEEYPNRLPDSKIVRFTPHNDDLSYSVHDLIEYFDGKEIDTLLLVNPDNPSGNFIARHDILALAEWCRNSGIRLIVDESFVDFAEAPESQTLLSDEILESHPNMCVVKSISKSYGVPGLRLGIVASADQSVISEIKRSVAIWNINSFAEFYMQIFGKYENDYALACKKFIHERKLFQQELSQIDHLRVIPSQANYFLCEITNGMTAHELTLRLLTDHNILIKDCSTKQGIPGDKQYVRIAVRNRADNSMLATALHNIFTHTNTYSKCK